MGQDIPAYEEADWRAFAVTVASVLCVYLLTLSPNVGLGFSGIFSTAAMYGGVPHPPGYPVAVWWQGLFVQALPISNIGWRVAVSSATAGAVACGLIALLVSRLGKELLRGDDLLTSRETTSVRILCGFVAGTIFGFNGAFWGRAVIADVWTLSIALFCTALCLLVRWCLIPHRSRFLYLSAFVYGLTLTNSQILLTASLAVPALLLVAKRDLARDVLLAACALFFGGVIDQCFGVFGIGLLEKGGTSLLSFPRLLIGLLFIVGCIQLIAATGRILSEWKTVLGCSGALLLGLTPYFYVPVVSMTNPPMNWGYARSVGGFSHVMTRGQYEAISPPGNVATFTKQIKMYAAVTAKEFGWPFVILACLPWLFFRQLPINLRRFVLAFAVLYLCLTLLLIAALNPVDHWDGRRSVKVFFSASYVVLAIWLGLGLMQLAAGMRPSKSLVRTP